MRNYYFLETLKIVLGSSIIHYLYSYLLGVFFKIPIHINFQIRIQALAVSLELVQEMLLLGKLCVLGI